MSILHSLKRRELLKEKAIILAEQMFVTGDICRHFNFHRADTLNKLQDIATYIQFFCLNIPPI